MFRRTLRDPLWLKIYVGIDVEYSALACSQSTCQVVILFLADTMNAAFNLAWIYVVLINNFGASGLHFLHYGAERQLIHRQ